MIKLELLFFYLTTGEQKVLVVNQRNHAVNVYIRGAVGGKMDVADQVTSSSPSVTTTLKTENVALNGLGVAVETIKPKAVPGTSGRVLHTNGFVVVM